MFFGLLSMGFSATSRYSDPVIVASADVMRGGSSWEVSANFSKGDYILADYRIHPAWANEPYEMSDYFQGVSLKIVWIEIHPPDGGNHTLFSTVLSIDKLTLRALGFLAVTVLERGTGLIVKTVSDAGGIPDWVINKTIGGEPIEELPAPWIVGGIARYDGTYTLRTGGPYPQPFLEPGETLSPPDYLALGKSSLEYPLFILLPVGGVIFVPALVLVIWSRKKTD